MRKGIIMKIDDAFLTLLTPEGEFLQARKQEQPYSLGEEIHFFPLVNKQQATSLRFVKTFMTKPAWIAALVLLILVGSTIPMYQNSKAYAYMSIDVNPSIELGINKQMRVVELTAYNQQGKKVISQLAAWKNKDVSTLTESILEKMEHDGYLKNNKQIIISTVCPSQPDQQIEKDLQNNLREIKTAVDEKHLKLELLTGTEKELQKAHKLGITAGKYQSENTQIEKEEKIPTMNKQDKKQNIVPSQKSNVGPPGQLKKQTEDGIKGSSQSGGRTVQIKKYIQPSNKNIMAPGQWKKNEENQLKQNSKQLQIIKQSKQSEKFKQNDSKSNQNGHSKQNGKKAKSGNNYNIHNNKK